ncbi:alanine racemase [Hydrogenimonas cancrithermarum]|uniref:Alanine racemase n=1 Tax=Hydrogenimonas cancrithermarum TaxID=2993563 RepID=A0ABM8FLQ1_9BACT|nr:alanine racemase [Hydrogenimonas cancrithermarum]BDY12653.1 alanine racemase [Hydrogenimonas cancrithermarum]
MSTIKISRENFFYNISQIARKTQSVEKIALVLKDNAYGHGLGIMAKLAQEAGIRHAVVRTMAEAWEIHERFETILVLSDTPVSDPGAKIRIAVNDRSHLEKIPTGTRVELKVDTGMHRNGISPTEFFQVLESLGAKGLKLSGVMTHYRSADEMGSELFWQRKRFERIRNEAEKLGIGEVRWHSCNSAALFRTTNFDEGIARIGIAAYGCLEMPNSFNVPPLKPVMSLWADRIATRELAPSERIGYGGEGVLSKGGIVSTYDIGYGDGWFRGDASRPYTLPDGRKIVGRVSMDAVTVEGKDESVQLFDDARRAAKQFDTIAYDILVKLSPAIVRVVE